MKCSANPRPIATEPRRFESICCSSSDSNQEQRLMSLSVCLFSNFDPSPEIDSHCQNHHRQRWGRFGDHRYLDLPAKDFRQNTSPTTFPGRMTLCKEVLIMLGTCPDRISSKQTLMVNGTHEALVCKLRDHLDCRSGRRADHASVLSPGMIILWQRQLRSESCCTPYLLSDPISGRVNWLGVGAQREVILVAT